MADNQKVYDSYTLTFTHEKFIDVGDEDKDIIIENAEPPKNATVINLKLTEAACAYDSKAAFIDMCKELYKMFKMEEKEKDEHTV